MLIVLTATSNNVNTTTVAIEPIRILMFPHIETKLIWNARSVSARTSAELFANALLMRSITNGASSADVARTHHAPTLS